MHSHKSCHNIKVCILIKLQKLLVFFHLYRTHKGEHYIWHHHQQYRLVISVTGTPSPAINTFQHQQGHSSFPAIKTNAQLQTISISSNQDFAHLQTFNISSNQDNRTLPDHLHLQQSRLRTSPGLQHLQQSRQSHTSRLSTSPAINTIVHIQIFISSNQYKRTSTSPWLASWYTEYIFMYTTYTF